MKKEFLQFATLLVAPFLVVLVVGAGSLPVQAGDRYAGASGGCAHKHTTAMEQSVPAEEAVAVDSTAEVIKRLEAKIAELAMDLDAEAIVVADEVPQASLPVAKTE